MFVIPSLVGGGAERVAVLLMEHLDRERFQPSLVMFQDRCDYKVPDDVQVACLNKRGAYDFPKLIWRLARAFERNRPDVVLGFMDYANLIAVLARRLSAVKPRVILTQHNHTSIDLRYMKRSRALAWGIPRLYPQSDGVVCVSQGVADDLVANFRVPRQKTRVIYNPVDVGFISGAAREDVAGSLFDDRETPVVIGVGRLIVQKGFPHLLRAFARVRSQLPCRLVILGDGGERDSLEALARELGVHEDVTFLGFQRKTFRCMGHSDVFVLSSLWEGMPMVIIEAMACGVPIVATRCPSGPEEVITDGVNGLLVPVGDEKAMAETVLRLLRDNELRAALAEAAKKRAGDFDVGKAVRRYQDAFLQCRTGEWA